jgi:LemA protein
LSGALSRLLVVSENYPNLKADANFRDLQAQLEGHRESHHGGPEPLYQGGAGLQHIGTHLPQQFDRDGHRCEGKKRTSRLRMNRAISEPPKVNFGTPAAGPAPAKAQ